MTLHAVQLHAAGAAVAVVSFSRAVPERARRCFGQSWQARWLSPESECGGAMVIADVDPEAYAGLAARVTGGPHETVVRGGVEMLVAPRTVDGVTNAVVPGEGLACRWEPDAARVTVYGCSEEPLARAAVREVRTAMRAELAQDGWSVVRACAVVRDGQAVLVRGGEAAGVTLGLVVRGGWELLADGLVFVRADAEGGVRALPFPPGAPGGLPLARGGRVVALGVAGGGDGSLPERDFVDEKDEDGAGEGGTAGNRAGERRRVAERLAALPRAVCTLEGAVTGLGECAAVG
jgi:hypothetical protein